MLGAVRLSASTRCFAPPHLVTRTLPRHSMSSSTLASASCVPCKRGSPAIPTDELPVKLSSLASGWELKPFTHDIPALQRTYTFRNFRTALAFTNKVGAMAEEQKHHPALVTEWGSVRVAWWTHAIGGLHENDFICAVKTEELATGAEGRKE